MKSFLPALLLSCAALTFAASCSGGGPKNEPTAPAASETPRATQASRENLPKIVAFGDSLTAGYGLNPQESYPALLQKRLDADGYRYEVVNAGVSGDTSAAGLRRVEWSLAGDVRVVILELGANDHLRGQPVAETKKNLGEIIRQARARDAQVILAGMLTTTNAGDQYQREIAGMYGELAREHNVVLIPFFLENVAGVESLNLEDRVHPNAEGTKIVAETVYRALKPLLEKDAQEGR